MDERRALRIATAAYVLGMSAHMTYVFYLAPVSLRLAGEVGRDAWVFSGTAVATVLTVIPAGWLADRFPRRYILRGALGCLAAAYAPLLVQPTFEGVVAGTALTGTGLGLLVVSFNAYVADLLAAEGISRAYGQTAAAAILASALGPALAALVFRLVPDAIAVPLNALLFGIAGLVGLLLAVALPRARLADTPSQDPTQMAGRQDRRTVVPMTVLYLVMGVGYGMTLPYFVTFFLDEVGLMPSTWGFVLAVGTFAAATGSLVSGQAGRLRPRAAILTTQAGHVAASLLFLLPLAAPALALVYVLRNGLQSGVAPHTNALLTQGVKRASRAQAQAWASLAWNVGWASGAAVGGALLARLGGAVFPLGAAIALAGTFAGLALLPRPATAPRPPVPAAVREP